MEFDQRVDAGLAHVADRIGCARKVSDEVARSVVLPRKAEITNRGISQRPEQRYGETLGCRPNRIPINGYANLVFEPPDEFFNFNLAIRSFFPPGTTKARSQSVPNRPNANIRSFA